MSGRGHRDLLVWQKAMELAEAIYKVTGVFPVDLAKRLRFLEGEAAASLNGNIAEIGRMLNGLRSSLSDDRRPKTGD